MKITYTISNGIPQEEVICENCGKTFYKNARKIKITNHNFCGNPCKFAFFKSKPREHCVYKKNSVLEMIKLKRESQKN